MSKLEPDGEPILDGLEEGEDAPDNAPPAQMRCGNGESARVFLSLNIIRCTHKHLLSKESARTL